MSKHVVFLQYGFWYVSFDAPTDGTPCHIEDTCTVWSWGPSWASKPLFWHSLLQEYRKNFGDFVIVVKSDFLFWWGCYKQKKRNFLWQAKNGYNFFFFPANLIATADVLLITIPRRRCHSDVRWCPTKIRQWNLRWYW